MEPVILIGGGGHAKVIIDIFQEDEHFEVIGCTVSNSPASSVLGVRVLGDDSQLSTIYSSGVRKAFVAIGDNRARRNAAQSVLALGFTLINAVSRRAIVSPRVTFATGIAIMPGAVINACSRLGDGCIVNTGATIDHDCEIGNWAHVAPGTNLAGCVTVGDGAFLGVGCRVIPGIKIGDWSTIGAGATVISDVPARVTAVGVPARVKGDAAQ